jgi:hypothetical protein
MEWKKNLLFKLSFSNLSFNNLSINNHSINNLNNKTLTFINLPRIKQANNENIKFLIQFSKINLKFNIHSYNSRNRMFCIKTNCLNNNSKADLI